MDFEQLRAFYTLAQTKNFTKAAEMLHLVQSTVTMRIKQLEEKVGKPLFTRDKRSVEITQAGLTLLPYAERILKLANEALSEVASLQPYEDYLSIGSLNAIWTSTLEPILKEYHYRYPQIAISTKTGHSSDVIQYLLDNMIQIGIVYIPPSLPNFEVIPTWEDEIVLVCKAGDSVTAATHIDARELRNLPLLYVNWGPPFDEWIRQTLPRNYVPKLHVDKAELAIDLVKEGLGVSLLTRSTVKADLAAGTLKEMVIVGSKPPKRSAYIVLPKDKKNKPSVEKWLSLMKEFGYSI
ncbi:MULTISPECIES: LysR family transcriptional regulator [Brevibacillus]|jgi:LysR family transcriptional repressor of citA|uniref:Transcriptional regulator n=1 Tax=Brevibacillus borstelensis AK1 TaxID=1300222 RepID=M8DK27_9BACL|nr:LysR family transcriptional regulator [Brevibacillus borstelensis]EMT53807.1 transcriptional regulator [Brevibacillus borstelensis AK1]KKX56791.1 transcriptional regulator [Brevibacillus borstelensis cifa_chp40]MBE5395969.1 LysR family transcriptional regulator [Brevibacillus borstelensis]MCC0566320.1 LysR family transcriptional regulator [Brevibacillus borstelensis]MCM3473414.1 LysR family transcriptional regulator [Brevibacillus borstelensis]